MPGWLSKLMSAQFARASDTATPAKFFSLERLFLVCAVTLALIVVGSASLIVLNLRDRVTYENERALTNSTLIIAKQIEQAFAAVEAAQKEFSEDISRLPGVSRKTFETNISSYGVHLKLRDKAIGIPYVGAFIIYNADGKLINYSRQWPLPDINIADRDYFKAAKSDPVSKSILSEPVRNRATGSWVANLVRKISAPDGEFLGVISASFELGFLQKYFSEISADPDSSFALFRNDGTLLARFPQNDVDIGRRWPNAVALKITAIANHGVGMSEGMIDGVVRMVAARRVADFPVLVTATKSRDALLAGWRKTAVYIGSTTVLIIVIITAFTLLFTRLLRNYQALVQARAERNRAELLRQQSLRFDVALNNMSHGLVMFDASSRIVVCNSRFVEMYNVSRDVVKPGLPLLDLLKHRKECGSFAGDPVEYHAMILDQISRRKLTQQNVPTPAGRIIKIVNQPMPEGGWVATHEDITDKVEAEHAIRKQDQQIH
ncbi:MAG: PAS-domain containing protein, partial [Pseudolabrys sp.]